jgi:hypothetical protein
VLDAVQQQCEQHAAETRAEPRQQGHRGNGRNRTMLTTHGLRSDGFDCHEASAKTEKEGCNDLMPRRNMNQIDFYALLMRAAHR